MIYLGTQFFAGQNPEAADGAEVQAPAADKEPSFDELLQNRSYQSEFDRRVSKALETAKSNWESEVANKISEAEKLARMNAEQKAQYEREQAERKLAEREAVITRKELRLTAIDALAQKGYPIELADALDYTDAEVCDKSIDRVGQAFQKAVEHAVNDRLRSTPPKAGGEKPAHYTREQLKTMSVDEINRNWESIKNNV